METRLYRATVFALYQLSLIAGILMLPFALVARQFGLSVPMHRVVLRLERAYDSTTSTAGTA